MQPLSELDKTVLLNAPPEEPPRKGESWFGRSIGYGVVGGIIVVCLVALVWHDQTAEFSSPEEDEEAVVAQQDERPVKPKTTYDHETLKKPEKSYLANFLEAIFGESKPAAGKTSSNTTKRSSSWFSSDRGSSSSGSRSSGGGTIPEPSTIGLLATGVLALGSLLALRRRRSGNR